jgi:energy-coupling factor transport system permease protein
MVLAAAVVLLACVERVPRVLLTALVIAMPVWVFVIVIHWIIGHAPDRAMTLGARITAMIVVFLTALASVHPGRLVDALIARRFPFEVAYLFSATLQAVPRLRARAHAILDAQRCRGLRVAGSPWRRVRAVVPLALPLVLGALAEVDERAVALDARGATAAARRTALDPPHDTVIERIVRWTLLAAVAGTIAARLVS